MINEMINSKTYSNFSVLQKENALLKMFHSINFDNIPAEERIILLKEFENVEAIKQKRESFNILAIDPKDNLLDAGISYSKKQMYFNANILSEGLSQIYFKKDEIAVYRKLDFLNLFLLDCILHEQFHIITNNMANSENPYLYRELIEYLIHLHNVGVNDVNSKKYIASHYYKYITNPFEFYAFQYAEVNTLGIMGELEKELGKEKNLESYLGDLESYKQNAVDSYFTDTGISLSYEDLYKKRINEEITDYSSSHDFSVEDLNNDVGNAKSLIRKYSIKQ